MNRFLYSQSFLAHTAPYRFHDRSKMIAKGKKLIFLTNHYYQRSVNNTVERVVDPREGLLLHYRDYTIFDEEYLDDDWKPALKFRDELRRNVDEVCGIFEGGVCFFQRPGEDSAKLLKKKP